MIRFLLHPLLLLILFAAALPGSAQIVSFDRGTKPGEAFTAEIRMILSREYLFLIPGAGKPVRKQETMDLVLLADVLTEKVNAAGNPVTVTIEPIVAAGSLNGRRFEPELLKGRKIRAELGAFPCVFTPIDGKPLEKDARVFLSAIFRVQPETSLADTFGRPRAYIEGNTWTPDTTPLRAVINGRGFAFTEKNLPASARFEKKFKVKDTDCVAVILEVHSEGTFDLDFRLKTRIVLPADSHAGGVWSLTREGREIVDRKIASTDPAAAGMSVRVITNEQSSMALVPKNRKITNPDKNFFNTIFR